MSESESGHHGADFLYTLARHQVDKQLESVDSLDVKLGVLFASGSAEIAIAAAFLALRQGPPPRVEAAFLIVGVVAYLVLIAASVTGLRQREWQVGPQFEDVARLYYEGSTDEEVKQAVTRHLLCQRDRNEAKLRWKVRWLRYSFAAVAAQTIAALLAVSVVAMSGGPP